MRFVRDLPLGRKVTLITLVTTLGAILAIWAGVLWLDLGALQEGMARDLETLGGVIGSNCTAALAFGDREAAGEILTALREEGHVVSAALFDRDGKPFASYARRAGEAAPEFSPGPDGHEYLADALIARRSIRLDGDEVGTLIIRTDLSHLENRVAAYGLVSVVVFAVALALAISFSSLLQGIVTRPIRDLSRIAQSVSEGKNFSVRAPSGGRDEVGLLVNAFNEMLARIEQHEKELVRHRDHLEELVAERTAELREAKTKAEEAAKAKAQFLANMSHEIRTPMNAVIGLTELALDGPLSDELRDYLAGIRESGQALLSVINDVLDFSKIEVGRIGLARVEFSLRSVLGQVMRTLSVRAHEKGLELVSDFPPEVADSLVGDPDRLRQILFNLVGNAVKFTERGEVVARVEPAENGAAGVLHLSIRDTGIGIPEDRQSIIFEPFEQVDGSTTRRYGGTGLGLAITRDLVRMMGGRIWVESRLGQGSCFHVNLPFEASRAERPDAGPTLLPEGEPVLVLEPHPASREVLERLLKEWKMRPTAVAVTAEAEREFDAAIERGRPFRVVLLDSRVPAPGSAVLLKKLTRASPRPAVLLMARATDSIGRLEQARGRGIAAVVRKPIQPSRLLETILELLQSESPDSVPPSKIRSVPVPHLRPLRILVGEDNALNQKVTRRMLEKHGHEVAIASKGEEVVERALADRFDLVLMDIQMPGIDGLEACRRIREREAGSGRRLPIIALTAHALPGDRERCLQSGMDGYVSKPLSTSDLFESVRKILGGHSDVASDSAPLFDRQELSRRFEDAWDVLREATQQLEQSTPPQIAELREAHRRGDRAALARAAHSMKGALVTLGSGPGAAMAHALEAAASHPLGPDLPRRIDDLEQLLRRLARQLEEWIAGRSR